MNTFKVIVSAVIFNDRRQVLLGKRSLNEDVFPGLWGIPGGKVEAEAGANIIERTLQREVREEMGIDVECGQYLESACRVKGDEGKIYLVFNARHVNGEPQALEDTDEVRWWNIADLHESELTPHTYQNILDAAKLQA